MVKEASFGIIPLRKGNQGWEVCVVKHCSGHWSFPKGHPERGETPIQTAKRELKEETSLDVLRLLTGDTVEEKYVYRFRGELRDKTVKYFIAEVTGELVILQKELSEAKWLSIQDATGHVTFPQAKAICERVEKLLK